MTLFKTSILNGIAVLARILTSLLLNKVLAVYVGPAGYGVIGQFQSVMTMATTAASGAIGNGVTKYTAEFASDERARHAVWRTAFRMGLLGGLVVGAGLILAQRPLARWFLHDEAYASVFVWLAVSLLLMVFNALMLAVLNGLKAIRAFVISNIAGSLIAAAVSVGLVMWLGLYGALIALCVGQAAAAIFTAVMFRKHCELAWRGLFRGFDPGHARKLGGFALMAITSALVVPSAQLVIRTELGASIGWHDTGLWQALHRISDLHLLLLTSTLVVYFLPRFSELPAGPALRAEVARAYRFVVPLVTLSAAVIYLCRDLLVRLLLTDDFLGLTDALSMQVVGDFLKVCSWVASITLVSHARVRVFIVTEVIFAAIFAVATLVGAHLGGLFGTAAGYAFTYLLYLMAMLALFFQLTGRRGE